MYDELVVISHEHNNLIETYLTEGDISQEEEYSTGISQIRPHSADHSKPHQVLKTIKKLISVIQTTHTRISNLDIALQTDTKNDLKKLQNLYETFILKHEKSLDRNGMTGRSFKDVQQDLNRETLKLQNSILDENYSKIQDGKKEQSVDF